MSSLKQFIPVLSEIFFNLSEHALYERQRELMRAGLLSPIPGRGPGSGVPLNSDSVAMLMVAALATDNLSEVGNATKILIGAMRIPTQASKSLLVGAANIHAAISRAISSGADSDRIRSIKVNRLRLSSVIYTEEKPEVPVLFLSNHPGGGNFSLEAGFHGDTFFELHQLLSAKDAPTKSQLRLAKNRMERLDAVAPNLRKR
ncbi:hypothetical protein [Bradyrhizobium sp. Ash2021]|uniref:hypothetical protein n=1 Tax=Bradyrhizobium sp. Ash2021 TaxID=2954771 RepID=UPI0028167C30|nr:hypothetical protein [Bradyrhizobium sp. Ash2021]WMT78851.1 hypothetical protein NL528_22005 [Bradyrhizobium sp. Ash2021]